VLKNLVYNSFLSANKQRKCSFAKKNSPFWLHHWRHMSMYSRGWIKKVRLNRKSKFLYSKNHYMILFSRNVDSWCWDLWVPKIENESENELISLITHLWIEYLWNSTKWSVPDCSFWTTVARYFRVNWYYDPLLKFITQNNQFPHIRISIRNLWYLLSWCTVLFLSCLGSCSLQSSSLLQSVFFPS